MDLTQITVKECVTLPASDCEGIASEPASAYIRGFTAYHKPFMSKCLATKTPAASRSKTGTRRQYSVGPRPNRFHRFLRRLHAGGRSNMYGAIPYLMHTFALDREAAFKVVCEWVDLQQRDATSNREASTSG
jgi:hypothetical protein